jgi:hypothetical protein
MAVAGGLLLFVAVGKWPVEWLPVPFIAGVAVFGFVPFWEWATWPKERSAPPPAQPQYAAPAPQPAAVVARYATGTVMGKPREPVLMAIEPRSARWLAWQRGSEILLAWYTIRRTLTAEALVDQERAFSSRPDWVTFTDEWARVELAVKINGRATQLAAPLPVIRARITSGQIEWTDAADPPAIVAPPRPAVGMVIEAQKA